MSQAGVVGLVSCLCFKSSVSRFFFSFTCLPSSQPSVICFNLITVLHHAMNTSIQTRSRSSSLGPNLDVVTTVAEPLMVNQLATEAAEEPGECNKTDISPSPPKSAVQVSIESLMTSLKDEFGDKIKDKRMAKSMAKLSKDSETLVQNFEQVIEVRLKFIYNI